MGRQNGEDYSVDYLVMLNTWEAALTFLSADSTAKRQAIDIARLLGWTSKSGYEDQMTKVAKACNAGHALIVGG
jgi:hypothetical protein